MRYLCLIYADPARLAAMPEKELSAVNARHLEFNEELLARGHYVEAEALQPPSAGVRLRAGKIVSTDGPYAETKEMLAGFYLLEALDLNEAIQLAATIPCPAFTTVEVRPCLDLVVDGVARRSCSKAGAAAI